MTRRQAKRKKAPIPPFGVMFAGWISPRIKIDLVGQLPSNYFVQVTIFAKTIDLETNKESPTSIAFFEKAREESWKPSYLGHFQLSSKEGQV